VFVNAAGGVYLQCGVQDTEVVDVVSLARPREASDLP
jgi:hypothetical protein